jgi:cell division protein FtsA
MLFALDIGTRTVVGVTAQETEKGIEILDFEIVEHEERAMLDGQINDVPKVTKAVQRVRKALEERNNMEFPSVSTAVAGRFLKTVIGSAKRNIPPSKINEEFVRSLEFEAISDAVKKNGHSKDYCVGYSVLEYLVDGEKVRNLIGQYGDEASVSLIAAFLPQRVVEALFSVVEEANLSLNFLTLEPMAAMSLVVPPDLRRLNIALIDVGAGTSDIAISKDGTIMAYGMIPMAGDEITEKICDKYLLSFEDGERVKRAIASGNIPNVNNILGIPVEISLNDLIEVITPVIDNITDEIAKAIFDLNGTTPAAVVIVGGGAKIPLFAESVANKLSLPPERVALRGIENISYIVDKTGKAVGSEFVTPVGIAYAARNDISKIFKKVTINSKAVQLMNLTGREDIFQALMQAGFDVKEIIGKPSAGITYELNGKIVVESGNMPEPEVTINGERASLHSPLNDGDVVSITPHDGKELLIKVKDVVKPLTFYVSDKAYHLLPTVKKNSQEVSPEEIIQDGDSIEYEESIPVEDAMQVLEKNCFVTVNGKKQAMRNFEMIDENGKILKRVKSGQHVKLRVKDVTVGEILSDLKIGKISVELNSKKIELKSPMKIMLNGQAVSEDEKMNCGDKMETVVLSLKIYDLFKHLHFNPDGLRINLNGSPAKLDDTLQSGDNVEVKI